MKISKAKLKQIVTEEIRAITKEYNILTDSFAAEREMAGIQAHLDDLEYGGGTMTRRQSMEQGKQAITKGDISSDEGDLITLLNRKLLQVAGQTHNKITTGNIERLISLLAKELNKITGVEDL